MVINIGSPVAVAAFVGRRRERAKVGELVRIGRVVTLTGSGGCGKTRLAAEVVSDVAQGFSDGACWVDLQGVSEPTMVAATVGAAVGVHEQPEQPWIDTLAERLRVRHLLIALDNCEHLVGACAELVAGLASACPELHVLATSRVPLAVAGESTFEVAPLPVPDADETSVGGIGATDAVRLFDVRARQVIADFRIDDDNAAAVAEICRRLDGIPLAIELAAARVRVLAPAQIAAGLSDRFGLLTGGVRGAPARQRTLEGSLAWSYDLLDDRQRLALARLSVFAGSFELDAAEAVVGGDGIDGGEVLDLVAGLIEQSMVEVASIRGRARYRLLETIRVYARQRLSELDDLDQVRARHLAFHVGLAARAREGLHGRQPGPWVARLTADLDNLLAAMDFAAATGDLLGLVDLTEPVSRFWMERGLSWEVHRRLYEAARLPGAPDAARVRGLNTAATMALGEPASFHRSASDAVAAARSADVGDPLAIALGHRALSGLFTGSSTDDQVKADVARSLRLVEGCRDAPTRAHVLQWAGAAVLINRSIDAGYDLFRRAIEVCEDGDLAFHLPAAHGGPLSWLVWSGRLDQVRRHASRALELSRQLGRPGWESAGLTGLAAIAVVQGDHDRACERLSEAQAALGPGALERTHYGMWARHWLGLSAYMSGDLGAARATAAEIVSIGRVGGGRVDEAFGTSLLGMVAQDQARHDDARAHLEASRSLSSDPRVPLTLGRSLLGLAELAREDEDAAEAWELAHDGLAVMDDYGDRVGAVAALELLGDLAVGIGEPERALRLLAASERFHTDTAIARPARQADRYERAGATARGALDGDPATRNWEAGRALSVAEAVAYARRGRAGRGRPRVGWRSLTPAELDVVRLVADGHTNARIGEQLFMSVNTVKKHLKHVYTKVDVGGRADLAAQAARRGL